MVAYLNVTTAGGRGEPAEGAPDQGFLRKMGGRGFPYCAILNGKGEVIWEARPSTADAFKTGLARATKLQGWKDMLAKDPSDKAVAANVAILHALGCQQREAPELAELEKHAAVKGVDKELLAEFNVWKADKKIEEVVFDRSLGRKARAAKAYEMFKAGTRSKTRVGLSLYYAATEGAIASKDKKTANACVDAFALLGKDLGMAQQIGRAVDQLRAKVAAMDDEG